MFYVLTPFSPYFFFFFLKIRALLRYNSHIIKFIAAATPSPPLAFFFLKLYIIVLVLPNIKMNPPQVYMCSPSWTLLPPPSPFHSSGSSQCTSPKHPVSCIEPGLATCFILSFYLKFYSTYTVYLVHIMTLPWAHALHQGRNYFVYLFNYVSFGPIIIPAT